MKNAILFCSWAIAMGLGSQLALADASLVLDQNPSQPSFGCFGARPENSYFWSGFAQVEQEMLQWNRSFQAAPVGSGQERYAEMQMKRAGSGLIQMTATADFSWFEVNELERKGLELEAKFQGAAARTYIEQVYETVRRTVWDGFVRSASVHIGCFQVDYQQGIQFAERMEGKFQSAAQNSMPEKSYDQVRRLAWDQIQTQFNLFSQQLFDFQELENLGVEFDRTFQAAPARSMREKTFDQLRRRALDQAKSLFQQAIYQLSPYEIDNLFLSYDRKYQAAPRQSLLEGYYLSMRGIAESASHRGYP